MAAGGTRRRGAHDTGTALPAEARPMKAPSPGRRPPLAPGLLLGVGLGGFVDGIVLHQILQWHHMLTATADHPADTVAGLEANTLADGLFHAATWMLVAVGTTFAIRDWQRGRLAPPWRFHVGLLLAGWGAFNLVEGLVDHHLLGVHHVRDDVAEPAPWDLAFLALALVQVVIGVVLARGGSARVGVSSSRVAGTRAP